MAHAAIAAMNARARALGRSTPHLPALLFFTDPVRTPRPAEIAAMLPRGAGVVFRHFGAADRFEQGEALARICRLRGLRLLIGADLALAVRLRADGVHLPERAAGSIRNARRRRGFLVTIAAHDRAALRRAAGADAAVLSPVFASNSPTAGCALGVRQAAHWARAAPVPVYALGGVTAETARALPSAFCGIAAVEGLMPPQPDRLRSD